MGKTVPSKEVPKKFGKKTEEEDDEDNKEDNEEEEEEEGVHRSPSDTGGH